MRKYLTVFIISLLLLSSCTDTADKKSKDSTGAVDTLQIVPQPEDTIVVKETEKPAEPESRPAVTEKTVKPEARPKEQPLKTVVETGTEVSVPLASWTDTKSKKAIIDFVKAVTTKGSPDYIPPRERVATFDNDGTLISEQPTYFQIEFILYRIKKMAPQHPKWKKDKLMQAAINHDLTTLRKKFGLYGIGKLMSIAQADITTGQYDAYVKEWMKNGRHPVTGKPYSKMVFQPMMELVKYLQQNGFKVYVVSDGDTDFIRAWTESVYSIPRENVIGSYQKLKFENENGKADLVRLAEVYFVDNGKEKPKSIYRVAGRRPVISFGNSDGDIQMMEWCASGKGKRLVAFIHHTDFEREYAYDNTTRLSNLDKGLELAAQKGWLVVDIKKEWKVIYPD